MSVTVRVCSEAHQQEPAVFSDGRLLLLYRTENLNISYIAKNALLPDMRATIAQKLARRQAHTPGLIYSLMVKLVMPALSKKLSPTFTYKAFPGKDKGRLCAFGQPKQAISIVYPNSCISFSNLI